MFSRTYAALQKPEVHHCDTFHRIKPKAKTCFAKYKVKIKAEKHSVPAYIQFKENTKPGKMT